MGEPGDDTRQDVGKIGEWLDVVELAVLDQGIAVLAGNHSVELASSDQIYGMPAECRSNQPIVPGRLATAMHMAKGGYAPSCVGTREGGGEAP